MSKMLNIHEKLTELTQNFWWSWQPEVTNIFRQIDPTLWTVSGHNPFVLLKEYPPEKLEETAREKTLHSTVNISYRRWKEYMASDNTWGDTHAGILGQRPAAYFSAEFGIHESLKIYSGGLGILSGDHLKSASDLGVPLIGIGLFYNEGYFSQQIDMEGWQKEYYSDVDTEMLPVKLVCDSNGSKVQISVDTQKGKIHAQVWHVQVGRVKLYLLDTNVEENNEEDRRLTARLYGGDQANSNSTGINPGDWWCESIA